MGLAESISRGTGELDTGVEGLSIGLDGEGGFGAVGGRNAGCLEVVDVAGGDGAAGKVFGKCIGWE